MVRLALAALLDALTATQQDPVVRQRRKLFEGRIEKFMAPCKRQGGTAHRAIGPQPGLGSQASRCAGVPNSPIQEIDEVLDHPQTAALGIAQQTEDPAMKLIGLPLSFDGVRPPLRNLAPALGTHKEV